MSEAGFEVKWAREMEGLRNQLFEVLRKSATDRGLFPGKGRATYNQRTGVFKIIDRSLPYRDGVIEFEFDFENRFMEEDQIPTKLKLPYAFEWQNSETRFRLQAILGIAKRPANPRVPMGLQLICLLVPKRLSEEEIGDALELIGEIDSRWKRGIKIASTIFWIIMNAVREVNSALIGKLLKKGT